LVIGFQNLKLRLRFVSNCIDDPNKVNYHSKIKPKAYLKKQVMVGFYDQPDGSDQGLVLLMKKRTELLCDPDHENNNL